MVFHTHCRAPPARHQYARSTKDGRQTAENGVGDGRFATLLDVVNHYDRCELRALSDGEKCDLVEYLSRCPRRSEHARRRTNPKLEVRRRRRTNRTPVLQA